MKTLRWLALILVFVALGLGVRYTATSTAWYEPSLLDVENGEFYVTLEKRFSFLPGPATRKIKISEERFDAYRARDIALAPQGSTLEIRPVYNAFTFRGVTTQKLDLSTIRVQVTDVDGDGKPDLYVADPPPDATPK